MEIIRIGKQSKSKHKFGGTKACESDEIRECFINPNIEDEAFG